MSYGLAIVGYGKMGRLIEQLAPEYGFEVRAKFDGRSNSHGKALSHETLRGVDAAVEFTSPEAALENIRRLAVLGVNTVAGTTGWFDELPSIREAVAKSGTGLVWAANFSLGVNLFLQAVAHMAGLFAKHAEYEAWAWEIHHSTKKDAISHPGTHEIGFDSAVDTITLRHTARNREGFARGALRAARWVVGKKGMFEFREILGELG